MLQNPHILPTFHKIDNPLHLRRRTTFEHPKVVREPLVFEHSVFKCALRHNGVHSFDIATSKSGFSSNLSPESLSNTEHVSEPFHAAPNMLGELSSKRPSR